MPPLSLHSRHKQPISFFDSILSSRVVHVLQKGIILLRPVFLPLQKEQQGYYYFQYHRCFQLFTFLLHKTTFHSLIAFKPLSCKNSLKNVFHHKFFLNDIPLLFVVLHPLNDSTSHITTSTYSEHERM